MPRIKRTRRARRGKTAADGGMKGAEPKIDIEAQFDFMSGDPLKGQEADAMATYDGAEAFDKEGSKRAEQDTKQFENGLAAPRGNLSSRRTDMNPEMLRARVAAKVAKLLLPAANAEAIENQAALFAAHMPSDALAATLERCWYDRMGTKIASQEKAKKAKKTASEKDVLTKAAAWGDEVLSMDAMADGEMSAEEDLDEVAEDVAEAEDAEEVESMGMPSYAAKDEDAEEVESMGMPSYAAKDEDDEEPKAKESSKKSSPKIATPRRRRVTASDRRKLEVRNLSRIYASQNTDCPDDDAMKLVQEKFSY